MVRGNNSSQEWNSRIKYKTTIPSVVSGQFETKRKSLNRCQMIVSCRVLIYYHSNTNILYMYYRQFIYC